MKKMMVAAADFWLHDHTKRVLLVLQNGLTENNGHENDGRARGCRRTNRVLTVCTFLNP